MYVFWIYIRANRLLNVHYFKVYSGSSSAPWRADGKKPLKAALETAFEI